MQSFDPRLLQQIHLPEPASHKGQNGKLLLIGGSTLFHAASLWALTIASKILDMVFYASVPENNEIVHHAKQEFRNGIVIARNHLEDYMRESDCVLIGPGMVRNESAKRKIQNSKVSTQELTLEEINALPDEGLQSYWLTRYLLENYPEKKWVIDAGALQMMDPEWLRQLDGHVIVTPHPKEFETLFATQATDETVSTMAKEYNCTIVLKGQKDIVCSASKNMQVSGGNAGMTKGGTGDVLAGLIASLACTNEMFISAVVGSYLNKKAGDALYGKVGYYFNASDLANEIPVMMKEYLLEKKD